MTLNPVSLDTTIQDLHQDGQLSVRATNALKSAGLKTVEDVITFLEEGGSLLDIRNFGRKSYFETKEVFDRIRSVGFAMSVSQEVDREQTDVQDQERTIDDYIKSPDLYKNNLEWYKEEIGKCTYREFTTGFFFGKADDTTQIYDNNTYVKNYIYLGTVENIDTDNRLYFEQKNKFFVGDTIELMKKNGDNIFVNILSIKDEDGNDKT